MAEVTKSTSELDMQVQLAAAMEETIISAFAEQERKLAQTRTESTNIDVGTVKEVPSYIAKPGERVLGTFGRTQLKPNGQIVTPETAPIREVDSAKVVASVVNEVPNFNIEDEFKKLRSLSDPTQREDAAQLLFMNVGQQATAAQDRIRSIAAQRAGVNDAQAALDKNIALDAAAVSVGRIRPGDTTIQTTNARTAYQAALSAANALETDLVKKDPEIQKLNDYRALLTREFQQIDRRQDRTAAGEAVFGVMTDARIKNAQLALKLPQATTAIIPQIHASLKKDKALAQVLDADKAQFARLMVDPDMNVRRYTYNIIAGMEREHLGLGPKDDLPNYVRALEPLIANRDAILSQQSMANFSERSRAIAAEGRKKLQTTVGATAQKEAQTNLLAAVLQSEIESTTSTKYQDMSKWAFVDPQFKEVIDTVKVNTKDRRVLMTDGIDAIIKAKLLNPDKTEMSPQQKISVITESLGVSMDNDAGSALLPNAVGYKPVLVTQARNAAMKAYVRSTLGVGRFAGVLGVVSDVNIGRALLGAQEGVEAVGNFLAPNPTNPNDSIDTGSQGSGTRG